MQGTSIDPLRIQAAWQGRVSGCLLGKPVEVLSFQQGRNGLYAYLRDADALPLRDYVPLIEDTIVDQLGRAYCGGHIERADNEFNEWIGAQIRADLYGWVCPGRPALVARTVAEAESIAARN